MTLIAAIQMCQNVLSSNNSMNVLEVNYASTESKHKVLVEVVDVPIFFCGIFCWYLLRRRNKKSGRKR